MAVDQRRQKRKNGCHAPRRSDTKNTHRILEQECVVSYLVNMSRQDTSLWRQARLVSRSVARGLRQTLHDFTFALIKHRTGEEDRLEIHAVRPSGFADDACDNYRFLSPVAVARVGNGAVKFACMAYSVALSSAVSMLLGCTLESGDSRIWKWKAQLPKSDSHQKGCDACLHLSDQLLLGACGTDGRFVAFTKRSDTNSLTVIIMDSHHVRYVETNVRFQPWLHCKAKYVCLSSSSVHSEIRVFGVDLRKSAQPYIVVQRISLRLFGDQWECTCKYQVREAVVIAKKMARCAFDVKITKYVVGSAELSKSKQGEHIRFDLYGAGEVDNAKAPWARQVCTWKQRWSLSIVGQGSACGFVSLMRQDNSKTNYASILVPPYGGHGVVKKPTFTCRYGGEGGLMCFFSKLRSRSPSTWFKEHVASVCLDKSDPCGEDSRKSKVRPHSRSRHWTWLPADDGTNVNAAESALEDTAVVRAPLRLLCTPTTQ